MYYNFLNINKAFKMKTYLLLGWVDGSERSEAAGQDREFDRGARTQAEGRNG